MTKNIKLFLLIILLSIPFWLSYNVIQKNTEEFFYTRNITKEPFYLETHIFLSNINEQTKKQCFVENITAESFISQKKNQLLFQKNSNRKLPMASLTKLMTAVIAKEFYLENQRIFVSQKAINQLENTGDLRYGELLKIEDLLRIMLIESSNDAAFALTTNMTEKGFVSLMNLKAKELNMQDTIFYNVNGLDPDDLNRPKYEINISTTRDLVILTQYILNNYPEIIEIMSTKEQSLYLDNGILHHNLINTNILLEEDSHILGGKTGHTERAGGCLILILRDNLNNHIINIILNSESRFQDMEKLINCSLPFNSL